MKTILQVEDDPNDAFFFQRALDTLKAANPVRIVTDGQEAIDYLKGVGKFADRAQFPLPDLVLLDLKLPRVMGLDVLKWIRQEAGLDLVVLLLTASAEEVDIAAAYRLGANAFLVKPSEAGKMVDLVRAIRDFWLTHNTLPAESFRKQTAPAAPSRPTPARSKRLSSVNGTPRGKLPNSLKGNP